MIYDIAARRLVLEKHPNLDPEQVQVIKFREITKSRLKNLEGCVVGLLAGQLYYVDTVHETVVVKPDGWWKEIK